MRFDDINPRMDWNRFFVLKKTLEKYNIKSILGVIPDCKDPSVQISKPYKKYLEYLRKCSLYGDCIAQHGNEHIFDSKRRGDFGSSNNSEFAGHSLNEQFKRLSNGKKILEKQSLWEPIFMAPGHSFDSLTLIALKKLDFKIILDGFSLFPYKKNNLIFIPQISSNPLPLKVPGLSQLCIHINTITNFQFKKLIKFIHINHKEFISLEEIKLKKNAITYFDQKFICIALNSYRLFKEIGNHFIKIKSLIECFYQRLFYKIKYRDIDIYEWHLQGTYCCRSYKKISLKIINSLKPTLFIDIGCGLGEILEKLNLDYKYKVGFDLDKRLIKVHDKFNKNNFKFFTEEKKLFAYFKNLSLPKKNIIVISMLNFVQNLVNIFY
ncbi:DUF2334 domain-containing protein [Prochlorococcus sp. AH-716-P08]|nr:DUF2334 domain-containing protein [Prochlorococcus sp. AH-716-P08]